MSVIASTLGRHHEGAGAVGARQRSVGGADHPPSRMPPADLSVLTDREREVVALVALGLSNDGIARELFISLHTAKTHVHRAMSKVSARDRTQLVLIVLASRPT